MYGEDEELDGQTEGSGDEEAGEGTYSHICKNVPEKSVQLHITPGATLYIDKEYEYT